MVLFADVTVMDCPALVCEIQPLADLLVLVVAVIARGQRVRSAIRGCTNAQTSLNALLLAYALH